MGDSLTTAAVLTCPHGGTVSITSSNSGVTADGAPLALAGDSFTISGCPFQIPVGPGTKPSPCVTVKWLVTDLRATVNGQPTLSTASVGLCLSAEQVPQGSVVISSTQPKVSSS
ncbi:hypothetical protein [Pelobacter propionicus]|jgi:hypothetical protein|uniref:Uncharacterized protein n=1 Tax=Pelobacter propionicus (strain DSM 2379 / NBRC 103807 / OttBd1) TaxID=338966 RepID=A1AQ08_PELPD|nr:hypothetical protein [Pelobacter propionicus]ABK99428.1 conserved hypothetical protein [Pelobacter propionicus DSM 2379]